MFMTDSVQQIAASRDDVFAFKVTGTVSATDMTSMAEFMNAQFDRFDSVSMLLIFENYQGSETGAGFSWENLKAQVASLAKVEKYAVVGAPDDAAKAVETSGKLMPVDTKAFDMAEIDAAWSFVGARPA